MSTIRNWRDIPLFKGVTDEQWNDWTWQVANRLTTVEEIAQVVNLTEQERADIEKVMSGFRVGITPYYASLMDPDDPRCPVRMQAVPTLMETHRGEADMLDPLHEDEDSPAPGLTHRYPDRVLFLIWNTGFNISQFKRMFMQHFLFGQLASPHGLVEEFDMHAVHVPKDDG